MGMKYDESAELADQSSCAGVRADLKMCLLESECCKDRKKTPRECLESKDPRVPQECFALQTLFFECKRSMLDNRTRFRGKKGY
ncbi:cytochrome c oxidase assembly factor 5-like [Macrosteles quadrilineatus]|uniref:cytochrome c oxidase assembly factor 5-like n=1 Tax=Macrosteles quadrilineatus TaxID=74068 RepID=UPI0023E25561|nr:cytochrome c oxidase assembly factor 5-like [Macrosteles quadrilineatus]XP_054273032.1 cytochrome c oxidase assembly factor 5-like [Macrosteles quadrilineatus]XP_054273535.1 cytochrome c oxidase assembly factor 5-like [Macrosteles quadrilineatus]